MNGQLIVDIAEENVKRKNKTLVLLHHFSAFFLSLSSFLFFSLSLLVRKKNYLLYGLIPTTINYNNLTSILNLHNTNAVINNYKSCI